MKNKVEKEASTYKIQLKESVKLSDSLGIQPGIYFELSEAVHAPDNVVDSDDIRIVFDTENERMIKSFIVKVDDFGDRSVLFALQQASRLVNYLTFKTGIFVFHKNPKRFVNGEVLTDPLPGGVDCVITNLQELDLTNTEMKNMIDNDSRENQKMAHFASGQRALWDGNYSEAIREFFLVIEGTEIPEEDAYKPLRNAVSHQAITGARTIDGLRGFGIHVNEGDHLDVTSPEIQDILRAESNKIRNISISYLNTTSRV